MKNIHVLDRRLPLAALRAFESFARLGTVGLAAEELSITPSAVSHQLRALELHLEVALTERVGRNLQLTAAGRSYSEGISAGFSVLQSSTNELCNRDSARRISISSLNLIGVSWLAPILSEFSKRNDQIQFDVQYARYRNYSSDAADLSIRFGHGRWPGYHSQKIMPGNAYPVASSALREELQIDQRAGNLSKVPLIHDGRPDAWRAWFSSRGLSSHRISQASTCEDGMLVLASVRSGLGVALMRPLLIERELRDGEIVILMDEPYVDGQDYFLSVPSSRESSQEARKLSRWLLKRSSSEQDVHEIVARYLSK